jgi:hypothetical protein
LLCPADYGFEYSDEEPEEEDVDIENQYYNSKGEINSSWSSHSISTRCRQRSNNCQPRPAGAYSDIVCNCSCDVIVYMMRSYHQSQQDQLHTLAPEECVPAPKTQHGLKHRSKHSLITHLYAMYAEP